MIKHINAGEYAKACDAYLLYKYSGGHDCSIPGNKICAGVWTRQLERQAQCKEAQ
jgi:GH24 family phage-related lysozyme (muramidase)